MSIKAMVWAWAQDDLTSTETLVLLALADHADDTGFCWPGQTGIAAKTRLKRPTVNAVIQRLRDKHKLELIQRKDEHERFLSNQYQLCVKQGGNVIDADMDRVSQDRIDRVSQDDSNLHPDLESSEEEPSQDKEPELEPNDLVEAWNEQVAPLGLTKVALLSPTRRQKANHRLREHPDPQFWTQVLGKMRASPFLLGRTGQLNGDAKHPTWRANFDWLIENDTNCVKVYEGRYAKEN